MLIKLGKIIKDTREYKEITRAELSEFAFVSEEQIKAIEDNRIVPDFGTALLMFKFLEINVDWGWLRLITEIANFE